MTKENLEKFGIDNLRPTPIVLDLANWSTICLEEIIEDVIILVDSWEYSTDFLVFHLKTHFGGHALILGRPWLAMDDDFISWKSGLMTIFDGNTTKNLVLYPISKLIVKNEIPLWDEFEIQEHDTLPLLEIRKDICFKDKIEDDSISSFISNPLFVTNPVSRLLNAIMDEPN